MTLHSDMHAAGLVTHVHYSDLYVLDTAEARAILTTHGYRIDGWRVQRFTDAVTRKPSLDITFGADL